MKVKVLTTAILLSTIQLAQLAIAPPSLSQTDLNTQLQQALCVQDWGRALQVVDLMKRRAGRNYASQLTLFRGQLEVIARENAKVPEWTQGCPGSVSPANNQPANPNSSPQVPAGNQPNQSPGSDVKY